jgi:glycosyltransferase involved in cell wall biosynthesis
MKVAIIIPAYNEERFIQRTLDSLLAQTHLPDKIIVVDDNSNDSTAAIVESYNSALIRLVKNHSQAENVPGAKVIRAFKKGLSIIDVDDFDVVCKFDADLIFPVDYLERIVTRFRESENLGMISGHCTILKNDKWIVENQNNPDHIRGALKSYRTECFKEIGGLKESIGWDTVDEMLARFYGWEVVTIPDLHVKHLKPTGAAYHSRSKMLQGEAFYKMRYGWKLTFITALKMALNKRSFSLFKDYLKGYQSASKNFIEPIITEQQGKFIRNYRWKGIKRKLEVRS